VETGGKTSTIYRSVSVQLEAKEAAPGSCPLGARSSPTTVNLSILDDDEVVFAGNKTGFVCTSGTSVQAKFGVRFRGPENCKHSAVPNAQTTRGDLFVTAWTLDGSLDVDRSILCRK
jgi:hypothetical protein